MIFSKSKKKILFIGSAAASFDKKHRITLPKDGIPGFIGKMYLIKGYDGCIELRGRVEMEKFSAQLEELQTQHKNNRIHQRFCLGSIVYCTVDSKGKFTIPAKFLKNFSVGKDILLVGVGCHVELGDADIYEKGKSDNDVKLEDIPGVLNK